MDKQHFHRISVLDGNANCEVVAGADDIADAADSFGPVLKMYR